MEKFEKNRSFPSRSVELSKYFDSTSTSLQLERFTASSNASRLNHTILGSLLEETRAKREIVFQSVFDRE